MYSFVSYLVDKRISWIKFPVNGLLGTLDFFELTASATNLYNFADTLRRIMAIIVEIQAKKSKKGISLDKPYAYMLASK